jgi:hypothetical protein
MTKNPLIVSGPYTHENLAIFLFHGSDEIDGGGYASLTEAFEKKHVLVHETGTVGQLEVENLSETIDIFISGWGRPQRRSAGQNNRHRLYHSSTIGAHPHPGFLR